MYIVSKGLCTHCEFTYNNVVNFCSPAAMSNMGIFVPPVQQEVLPSADCRLQVWMFSN